MAYPHEMREPGLLLVWACFLGCSSSKADGSPDKPDARAATDAGDAMTPDAHASHPGRDASMDAANSSDASEEAKPTGPTWSGAPLFVAVGYDGIRLVSEDGVNWSSTAMGGTPGTGQNLDDQYNFRRVAFGADRFVTVGGGCLPPYTSCPARIEVMKSDRTWKTIVGPTDMNTYNWLGGVASNGKNLWVAVGGLGPVITSSDGDTWTFLMANAGMTKGLRDVAYGVISGQGFFVAVGDGGARAYSTDGMAWTVTDDGSSASNGFTSVAFGKGSFVAVGSGGRVSVSSDGKSWADTSGTFADAIYGIAFGAGDFCVIDDGTVYSSTDGSSWPWTGGAATNGPQNIVHYSPFMTGLFLGLSWTNGIRTSPDGHTWTTATVTTNTDSALESIAFSGD
jgi:hypothetical protein